MSSSFAAACSGLMYSGVPMTWPISVNIVISVRRCVVALATPKSMILGTGRPSTSATRMFEGLRSRWMTAFWCACCTPSQTRANSSSRSRVESLRQLQ
jgi:hypothetical protein